MHSLGQRFAEFDFSERAISNPLGLVVVRSLGGRSLGCRLLDSFYQPTFDGSVFLVSDVTLTMQISHLQQHLAIECRKTITSPIPCPDPNYQPNQNDKRRDQKAPKAPFVK